MGRPSSSSATASMATTSVRCRTPPSEAWQSRRRASHAAELGGRIRGHPDRRQQSGVDRLPAVRPPWHRHRGHQSSKAAAISGGSAPASPASTCSAITGTPRRRPGACRALTERRRPHARHPTGRSPTSTLAGVRPSSPPRRPETSFFAGPATDAGTPSAATLLARAARGRHRAADPARPRVAPGARLRDSLGRSSTRVPHQQLSRTRAAARAAWLTSSARTYGYSISPEDGVSAGATAEFVRRGFGSFADANVLTGDVRAYLPGVCGSPRRRPSVPRRRISTGDATAGRTFLLGGPASNALNAISDGSHQPAARLRDATPSPAATWRSSTPITAGRSLGRSAASAPGRCFSTPFTRRSSPTPATPGRGRSDAGRHQDRRPARELSADLVAGYSLPFTATVGAAWGHDGSGLLRDRATVYFRVGTAF